jgi:L-lactate dehydrogenase
MSTVPQDTPRYRADGLVAFAHELLASAGVHDDIARDVADVLVDGDLLGHDTHGLALLAPYLAEIEKGTMMKSGEPLVTSARPAVQTWDGRRLPGPWVTLRALDAAAKMAADYGTGTVVVKRSHHIACLAAYLKRITDRKLMVLLTCSDPTVKSVAPFGGVSAVFTPNPLAAGIPTTRDPILLDISASCTTNGMTARLHQAGEQLAHPFIQDASGKPTRDPSVLFNEPKGTLLPLGGLEAGHKGFALALLVEAATGALAAHGRADPPEGWGATVFAQVLDPAAFGGIEGFERQIDWLADACRTSTPRPGGPAVRLPGDGGLARKRDQLKRGVALYPGIMPSLAAWSEKLGVPMPRTI